MGSTPVRLGSPQASRPAAASNPIGTSRLVAGDNTASAGPTSAAPMSSGSWSLIAMTALARPCSSGGTSRGTSQRTAA
jgi:hypothetical protein